MKRRIFGSMSLLALITVLFSSTLFTFVFYEQAVRDLRREMNNGAAYIAAGIAAQGEDYLSGIMKEDRDSRITLVDPAGTVLFDSEVPVSQLDNHGDRPEIVMALQYGRGETDRMSATLGKKTYYLALRLPDGNVLRLSSTTDSVYSALGKNLALILLMAGITLLFAVLLANRQTKGIVRPINTIDLDHPAENEIYEELSPLLSRINQQRTHIEKQMAALRQEQDRFEAIIDKMEEGLIVLDQKGFVLSINQSALKLFGAKQYDPIGRNILELDRSAQIQRVVEVVLSGSFVEEELTKGSFSYQIRANPVLEEGQVMGAVLLILDVTEHHKTEKMRREFSANVSHELKTPLTAISGFAELMKDGLVKPEDVSSFSGRIYDEAGRLIALVEDIMRLSRLDEKEVNLQNEKVDLLQVAKEVQLRLYPLAAQRGIDLRVEGENLAIAGVPQLIDELISNLCDNAIKYNREKGTVQIQVRESERRAVLSVIDDGIGIPESHQSRIFERFYRVDKSHSKETGGTGLGLSIVKHIAAYHDADILLESNEGKGTRIDVSFPLYPIR